MKGGTVRMFKGKSSHGPQRGGSVSSRQQSGFSSSWQQGMGKKSLVSRVQKKSSDEEKNV